jgi:hypothetical protein
VRGTHSNVTLLVTGGSNLHVSASTTYHMPRNTSVYALISVGFLGSQKQCTNSLLQRGKSLQSGRIHSVQKSKELTWRIFTFVRILRFLVNHSLMLQIAYKLKDEMTTQSINAKFDVFTSSRISIIINKIEIQWNLGSRI